MQVRFTNKIVNFSSPQVMGILNLTPDSFYTGGKHCSIESASKETERMISEGATIIDIGGESTNPQAKPISLEEERRRVLPILEALCSQFEVIFSIDTSQPQIMKEAVERGVGLINDVRALQKEGALEMAAQLKVPVCLMHMAYPFGYSDSVSVPLGKDPVSIIIDFFKKQLERFEKAGILRENILLDPGFGGGLFGKDKKQNLIILKDLEKFSLFGLPILIGLARKTFLGDILKAGPEGRLAGSLAAAALAVERKIHIIRTYDVKETVDVIRIVTETMGN